MDYIEPIPFLVIMSILVAAWLIIGIRDRRRRYAIDAEVMAYWDVLLRAQGLLDAHGCGRVWADDDGWHVCTRGYEHEPRDLHFDVQTQAVDVLRR